MSCSPFDLRDYFFGELAPAERSATENHLTACIACREELAKLSDVKNVLLSASGDEEPPRRIAFVSDKVFEPRWWQRLWTAGPQLGFAGAALLAAAILVHGVLVGPVASAQSTLPVPVAKAPTPAPVTIDKAAIETEIQRSVQAEVAKAVAAHDSEQTAKVLEFVNTRLQKSERRSSRELVLIEEYLEKLDKRNATVQRAMVFNE